MGFHKKNKYVLKYLDTSATPKWYTYDVSTYQNMVNILENNHNTQISKNILQNIYLQHRGGM